MSGRSRRKKLQRAKRISQADSFVVSPSSEAVTTNPLFSSLSDTIISSANEADLEDITSKEEKSEKIETDKEKGEKETEGNEKSSTISKQVQPQPLIPCGPIQIKVDSLQKTVNSDESATPIVLSKIKSNDEEIGDNIQADLHETNNFSELLEGSSYDEESYDKKGKLDISAPTSSISFPRIKSPGRITITKSDTIIETREADLETELEVETGYYSNSEINHGNDNVDIVDALNESGCIVNADDYKTEEESLSRVDRKSNKCLGGTELEPQSVYNDVVDIPLESDTNTCKEDNVCEIELSSLNVGQTNESSIHKDWNVIIEEDESEGVTSENEENNKSYSPEEFCRDTEPILVKIKSYDLPQTTVIDLLNSEAEFTQQNERDSNENKISSGKSIDIDNLKQLKQSTFNTTHEIVVRKDSDKVSSENLSFVLNTKHQTGKSSRLPDVLTKPCVSQETCYEEVDQWPATDVAEMGDSEPTIKQQITKNRNPKWRKAAVKAAQLKESSKKLPKFSGNGVLPFACNESTSSNLDSTTTKTGGGDDISDTFNTVNDEDVKDNDEKIILPPIILEGTPPPQSFSPPYSPPEDWKETSPSLQLSVISGEQYSLSSRDSNSIAPNINDGQLDLPLSSRPSIASSHSSVLVDMGKVIGVLRSTRNQIPAALRGNLENDSDDGNENDNISHHSFEKKNIDTDVNKNDFYVQSGIGFEDTIVNNSSGTCASCSSNTIQKRIGKSLNAIASGVGSSDLDDSLCGDPLMYATFVAPVHQYSTETEPSRQASFNYPSRQPSFKQNSSDAEGGPGVVSVEQSLQGSYSQFPGNLPVPGSRGKSRTPDKLYNKKVQDIYAEVPIEQWPLPPLPVGHHEIDAEDENNHHQVGQECVQEVSQEELEQQAHLERMSFISVSSANEEEEDFDENEQDLSSLSFPPLPPAPLTEFSLMQPKSRNTPTQHQPSHFHHIHQSYIPMPPDTKLSGGREATPMIHKSSLGLDDSGNRPINQRNETIPTWGSAGDIDECIPQVETFSSGTVRRKNKRERNRTNPEGSGGTLFRSSNNKENTANTGVGKSNTSLESASDMPDVTKHRLNSDRKPKLANNISALGMNSIHKRSKSRSKSRSPTRSNEWLDDDLDIPPPPPPPHQVCHHHQSSLTHLAEHVHTHHKELRGSDGNAEIVIVHRGVNQPKCSLHPRNTSSNKPLRNHNSSRNASPDNISESSMSFHENEFAGQKHQHTSNVHPSSLQHNKLQDNNSYLTSTSRTTPHMSDKIASLERGRLEHSVDAYVNRENVRESWATSSSSDRLTAINQGSYVSGGGSEKTSDAISKYPHQSRLNDSVVNTNSSSLDNQHQDNGTPYFPQHNYKQHDQVVTQQRNHYHHPKVSLTSYLTEKILVIKSLKFYLI